MRGLTATSLKFGLFVVAMTAVTVFVFVIFTQYRSGATTSYSALFRDVSSLRKGDSVRFAGIRVGTVKSVKLQPDKLVRVDFDADRDIGLTESVKAAVRYLNLVGDRYLELVDEPGSTRLLPPGTQLSTERTAPALDLDLLLGGLKPVVRGLNPQDINALTSALLEVFQDQGQSTESFMNKVSTLSGTLADNNKTVEDLIDNLHAALGTVAASKDRFSTTIDRLDHFVGALSSDRDRIGSAIDALSKGTASVADLLGRSRAPLAGSIEQLNKLAPALDGQKSQLESAIHKAPENYRKLIRLGAYGSFINYYICGITFRVSDMQGRTAVFPWVKQETGRCAEP